MEYGSTPYLEVTWLLNECCCRLVKGFYELSAFMNNRTIKVIAKREVSRNHSWLQSYRDKCLLDQSVSEDSKYTRDGFRCLLLCKLCTVTASKTLCSFSL